MVQTLKGNKQLWELVTKGIPDSTPDAERDLYAVMNASVWPDAIRDEAHPMHKEQHPNWHYINMPVSFDGKTRNSPPTDWKPGDDVLNVVQATAMCETDLKGTKLKADQKAIRVCWMLHLIGDVHQPMHAATLYSDHYAKGDEGGNREFVRIGTKTMRMHAYWDGLMGNTRKAENAARAADALLKDEPVPAAELKAAAAVSDVTKWVEETRKVAIEVAFQKGEFPPKDDSSTEAAPSKIGDDYAKKAKELARRQVMVAGARLAARMAAVLSEK